VQDISRRAVVKIGAVTAAGLVGIAGSVVTPAEAQQVASTISAIVRSVVICHSATPCIGGVNKDSNSKIPFGYRIVAKPYGVTAARLPMSAQSQMPARVKLHGEAAMPRPLR